MAVSAYTYDKLSASEQQALPDEGHLVAALEWAEAASVRGGGDAGGLSLYKKSFSGIHSPRHWGLSGG
jgi:hypothetical protein